MEHSIVLLTTRGKKMKITDAMTLLPPSWKNKAKTLSGKEAKRFRRFGIGVWIDDIQCPFEESIIIVDKHLNVFRLTDTVLSNKIIRFLTAA